MDIKSKFCRAVSTIGHVPRLVGQSVNNVSGALTGATRDRFLPSAGKILGQDQMQRLKQMQLEHRADQKAEQRAQYMFKFMNLNQFAGEREMTELKVGILGDERMKQNFAQRIDGKLIRGKPVKFVSVESPEDLEGMAALYMGPSANNRKSMFRKAEQNGLLTVESGSANPEQIAGIKMIRGSDKLRFRIDVDAIRRSQVKISPRLVKIAPKLISNKRPK